MFKLRGSFILIVLVGVAFFSFIFLLPYFFEMTYSSSFDGGFQANNVENQVPVVTHIETPESLKGLYMTSCVAGAPYWREGLKTLIETTELNAVVIDIKDYTGVVSIPLLRQGFEGQAKGCVVSDMQEFIKALHEAGIYVIGRISVFQDPSYSKLFPELAVKKKSDGGMWKDYKGLSFIDVGAKPYWDYIVDLSKKSYEIGFDELNYDYVRYPSDGNMQDTLYTWTVGTTTKPEMLESFFKYLHENMKDPSTNSGQVPVLSVDLFGMTTTVENDMNIGQVLELTLPYFDYVSPMVYPSHYPPSWNGFANPDEYPYEVVKIAMTRAVEREQIWLVSNNFATSTPSKMRPWLQDFSLGTTYGADKVRAQIQATYDVGLSSWMLWNAGNKYTKEALLPE
ncbi:MAG: putative glycoside hydrolase [bacterium]